MASTPSSTDEIAQLSHGQRERLVFIDFQIYFLGELGRNHLTTRFGIASAGATRDISLYRKLAPANLDFDTATKLYRPSRTFHPIFSHSADRALSLLAQGNLSLASPMVRCETLPTFGQPTVEVLAAISRAINLGKPILIKYCSVSSAFSTREVVPFALIDTGLRWHFRGFDRKSKSFRDFVLSRVTSVESTKDDLVAKEESSEYDLQWTRVIELQLIPHPAHKRPEAIALEYRIFNGPLVVRARAATVGYLLRRWNVDCSPDRSLVGPEFTLCLNDPFILYGAETAILAPGYRPPEYPLSTKNN